MLPEPVFLHFIVSNEWYEQWNRTDECKKERIVKMATKPTAAEIRDVACDMET